MSTPGGPPPLLPDLPDGVTARPLSLGDARDVYELLAADELDAVGFVEVEEADVVADWQRPSSNLASSTVGVFADPGSGSAPAPAPEAGSAGPPALVAYAEIMGHEHGCAAVHPRHRGRGIGTALARWMQATARARGMDRIGMPVPRGSAGDRLLADLGYEIRWESWFLELPAGARVPERALPAGYALREAREDELEAVWTVNEDAFLGWSQRDRMPYDEWLSTVVDRPGFEPWHLRVAVEAGDDGNDEDAGSEVVGMGFLCLGGDDAAAPTAYVAKLATRADRRGRGVGQALLADAFAQATSRGASRCMLTTDSRTGALGLYERVGMQVVATWNHRAISL